MYSCVKFPVETVPLPVEKLFSWSLLGDAHVRVSRPCVIVPLRPFIRTRGALEISHPEAVRQKEKREHKIFSRKFVHMK